jgi:hypothetical protein
MERFRELSFPPTEADGGAYLFPALLFKKLTPHGLREFDGGVGDGRRLLPRLVEVGLNVFLDAVEHNDVLWGRPVQCGGGTTRDGLDDHH